MDLTLVCQNAQIEPQSSSSVRITLEDADADDILDQIDVKDAVAHYTDETLLDIIGEEAARQYFKIEEDEEEE